MNRMLEFGVCAFAFFLAVEMASFEISVPTNEIFSFNVFPFPISAASVVMMFPDPVPMSSMSIFSLSYFLIGRFFLFEGVSSRIDETYSRVFSTRSSVSGRGMSVCRLTENVRPKNSFVLVMNEIGS